MITDAQGKPIASERSIIITEKVHVDKTSGVGKKMWMVDYAPSIQAFEFEEVFQVLGNVIAGIAQNARARKHEAMLQQQVKEKISEIKE